MKIFRKLVSIVAAATLLTSSLAFTFSANAAQVEKDSAVASESNLQGLQLVLQRNQAELAADCRGGLFYRSDIARYAA